MITGLAKSTACFFVKNGLVDKEDEEVYAYGMEILLSAITNAVTALLIAVLTDTFFPCLLFLVSFVTMRIYAGGYHADTHLRCVITLIAAQSVFIFIIKTISIDALTWCIPIFMAVSIPVMIIFAPVEHPNKPLSEKLKHKLRKKALISMTIWLTAALVFVIAGNIIIGFSLSSGLLMISAAMIAEKIKLVKKNEK